MNDGAVDLASGENRRSRGKRLKSLMSHPLGRVGLPLVVLFILIAIFAPIVATHDPAFQDVGSELVGPSTSHFLGTDQLGRDVFSRVVYGTRVALVVGLVAAVVGGSIGVLIGLIAGFYGGYLDAILMRASDVVLAFPGLLVALLLVVVLGPGLATVGIALAVANVPVFARIVRGCVLQTKEKDYFHAAWLFGASAPRLMYHHLLRGCISPVLVQFSLAIGISVILESTLSFLGFGIQPPTPSWGLMLNQGRNFLHVQPWFAIGPGIALALFIIGLVLLSDASRDVLATGSGEVTH